MSAVARVLRALWPLTWPVRYYWLHSERKLGKKLALDRILKPLLPAPPAGFEATLPGGGRVFLHHREDIGLVMLLSGGFETAETTYLSERATPGSTAIDVGANIGMLTVPLALAVGRTGRVLAFEPHPENVSRLEANLALNGLVNVTVHPVALGEEQRELTLQLGADPAYHSTGEVYERRAEGGAVRVRSERLDDQWRAAGAPPVSVLKIDTEGSELAVLRGGTEVLATCSPLVLAEASRSDRLDELTGWLGERGYRRSRPRGFAACNYIFEPS